MWRCKIKRMEAMLEMVTVPIVVCLGSKCVIELR